MTGLAVAIMAALLPFSSSTHGASTDGSASFLPATPTATQLRAAALHADVSVVVPGEVIADDSSKFLRGHGTFIDGAGRLIASVAGIVERVNKLISVRPPSARYSGEVGDVVVGRIVEVLQKRWLVDIGGHQSYLYRMNGTNSPSRCCWNRETQLCLNSSQCDPGGEGCIASGTKTKRYGMVSCDPFPQPPPPPGYKKNAYPVNASVHQHADMGGFDIEPAIVKMLSTFEQCADYCGGIPGEKTVFSSTF